MLTPTETGWVAGFLEGEGSFQVTKSHGVTISCHQVQRQPLEKLENLLTGTISLRLRKRPASDIYYWLLCSEKAIDLMRSIYSLMSPKRQGQIDKCLTEWATYKYSQGPNKQWCTSKKHSWTADNIAYSSNRSYGRFAFCRRCKDERLLRRKYAEKTII